MASIGTLTFTTFNLAMVHSEQDVRIQTRPGVNGSGVIFDAWRTPPITGFTAVRVAATARDSTIRAHRAMGQQAVSIVDQFNRRWDNVLIIKAVPRLPALGVDGLYTIITDWTVLPMSEAP